MAFLNIPHIYIITNNINDKVYIGQTNGHKYGYKGGGTVLRRAMKAHGRKNFIKNPLLIFNKNTSQKEIDFWEDFYIELFQSRNRNLGYNLKSGGKLRCTIAEETKEKIKLYQNTPEARLRNQKLAKNAAKFRVGTHHKKESKLQGVKTKFGCHRQIEIYNLDGTLFDTCDFSPEAAKLTGISRASISNNLIGISKKTRKYIFKYKNN